MENKFYKVSHNSGYSLVTGLFYNPVTKEVKELRLRDYEYSDGCRDNDELYYMEVDKEIRWLYLHEKGVIQVGDTIKIIKGRKVPIGTIAKVRAIHPIYDCYHRYVADYVYLDNGMKTNYNNCVLAD